MDDPLLVRRAAPPGRPARTAPAAAAACSWFWSQYSVIGTPCTSSITKYGRPVSVAPASSTLAMFGWSISASACRSASKRAITCRVSMPGLMTFSATLRRTGCCCSAMNTTPKPPSPICSSSLYRPMTEPTRAGATGVALSARPSSSGGGVRGSRRRGRGRPAAPRPAAAGRRRRRRRGRGMPGRPAGRRSVQGSAKSVSFAARVPRWSSARTVRQRDCALPLTDGPRSSNGSRHRARRHSCSAGTARPGRRPSRRSAVAREMPSASAASSSEAGEVAQLDQFAPSSGCVAASLASASSSASRSSGGCVDARGSSASSSTRCGRRRA